MIVFENELAQDDVQRLVEKHTRHMFENSPPGTSYAFDLTKLLQPEITFYSVRDDSGVLLGCGALKTLSGDHGEIKSMRTDDAHLRKGVARYLLEHMLVQSHLRGYRKLSLETGIGGIFNPANRLYESFGFQRGAIFGDYTPSAFNQFFHLDL